jgi:predicted dehydrogenase
MKLVILDPGHFHAALVQKTMLAGIDADVAVFAPEGPDLDDYLRKIAQFNGRAADPTHWRLHVHAGPDYLERFAAARAGDIVVIAGNNGRKAEHLERAVAAGYDVLGDKPLAIDAAGFAALARNLNLAARNGVLVLDIMTERHEITSMLQKALSAQSEVFGTLVAGTPGAPGVTKESVHHFAKTVAGAPLERPAWFFDVDQQGEGLVDITTHLVDLVQWACFPGRELDYRRDVEIVSARRWPTVLTPAQFEQVTGLAEFPGFLRKDVQVDGTLHVYANGEIVYRLRGICARVVVRWDFEAPAGAGDTHYSVMRGTRADLVIRQGAAERFLPTLYIEPHGGSDADAFGTALDAAVRIVAAAYPGVTVVPVGAAYRVEVPASYHVGHEAHFGQVADAFLEHRRAGRLPAWEVPNLLAKYATTTGALEMARRADNL